MAQTNVAMSQNNFYDLLRTLRFTLRSDFYQAYYLNNSISAYNAQIESVQKLADSFDLLLQKGTVTLKDAVRIKSLLYSLKTEQTLLQNQFNDVQSEIQQLLQHNKAVYIPVPDSNLAALTPVSSIPLQSLIDSAYDHRGRP